MIEREEGCGEISDVTEEHLVALTLPDITLFEAVLLLVPGILCVALRKKNAVTQGDSP
jgi:hypothetical protein